ncbi:putative germin-like protein 2-1 [Salvia hispanica]|uniref:putative germin-like protein 2-1 n=1 Tax=Salvia hispanica TaxID=49212 RepID=UPI002009D1A7|nr:putative germin-like protein 2-1 [Salvia hispanica]
MNIANKRREIQVINIIYILYQRIKMKISFGLCSIFLVFWLASIAYASDPSQLQDFCVAVPDAKNAVFVNGKFCKNPNMVVVDDFLFQGLNKAGNTSSQLGSFVTPVNVNQLEGLNTLSVSMARLDFAPYGINPPHTHPRATEAFLLVEGTLYVGFVTSNPADPTQKNKLFTKYLHPGDVFVFPQGLIHFQFNVGKTNAVAFAGFGSQNPGTITIANAVFGSDPKINPDVLAKAFQVEKNIIDYLQAQFWSNYN